MIQGSFSNHLGLMFSEIKGGKSGGEAPQESRGGWGAARPAKVQK